MPLVDNRLNKVVSLGGWCEPAWQIRKYTGEETAYFFDWLVSSAEAVVSLIENDFQHVFERHDLKLWKNGESVVDTSNGILFHHSFSRTDSGLVDEKTIDEEYMAQKEKVSFLVGRWKNLTTSGSHVLFVHLSHNQILYGDLLESAISKKYPGLNFLLLLVARPEFAITEMDSGRRFYRCPLRDRPSLVTLGQELSGRKYSRA